MTIQQRWVPSLHPSLEEIGGVLSRLYYPPPNIFSANTFKLYSSKDVPQKTYLQPIISPPEWNQALSRSPAENYQKTPIIMICGPKGSGKSTFAKLLTNRLLSPSAENNRAVKKPAGLAILDLDPGQPEYSAQGQLSLIHLNELNFGPPFTHPIPGSHSRIVRAHTIGAVSPSFDPILYMECVLDLFASYRTLLSTIPKCPLVINTPGWVLGTGLEILVELITKCRPTEVVYMSQDGPQEVVETLREAAKSTPLVTLPSQGSEYTTRTAAHLRTMQAMSYFHLKPFNQKSLEWDSCPLTSVAPWEVKYSGQGAGILGIMCYGEQPPASLLLEAINGSLLAIVVVDDMAAIPGWGAEDEDLTEEGLPGLDSPLQQSQDHGIQSPLIVHTPEANIPYFNPANTISLSPRHSHCLGLALLRGIDIPRQRLQLLTPISPKIIQEINKEAKSIVLVSGKLDTPGWAYVEGLVQTDICEKENRKIKAGDNKGDVERTEEEAVDVVQDSNEKGKRAQDVPWVEKLTGSQGRGIGGIWRVRRDLGRGTDAE
jgi:polynucleotide 5'-hydroxyl-kinase GRC3/NOL9